MQQHGLRPEQRGNVRPEIAFHHQQVGVGTGRYRTVAGNLRIKEVRPRAGDSLLTDRFVMMRRALNRIEAQSGAPWSVATT